MGIFQDNAEFWKRSVKNGKNSHKDNSYFLHSSIPNLASRLSNSIYIKSTKSKSPQAVIKIIRDVSGTRQGRILFDYISREDKEEKEKLSLETDKGEILENREERERIIEDWRKDFVGNKKIKAQQWKLDKIEEFKTEIKLLNKKPTITPLEKERLLQLKDQIENQYYYRKDKKTGKDKKFSLKLIGTSDCKHILLSVGGKHKDEDISKIDDATKCFFSQNFKENGFKYVFVRHNDTDNLHYHLIIKTKSLFGNNLHFDKADLFVLRSEFARHLSEMGIERVSTLRRDRRETLEKIRKRTENLKEKQTWYQNKIKKSLKIEKGEGGFNAFKHQNSLILRVDKSIKYIKREIKKKSDKGLKNDLKTLEKLKSGLKKDKKNVDEKTLSTLIEKTMLSLGKDSKKLIRKFEKLNLKQSEKLEKNGVELKKKDIEFGGSDKKRREYLKGFFKQHVKELKEAKGEILKKSGVIKTKENREQLKEVLGNLNEMIKVGKEKVKGK